MFACLIFLAGVLLGFFLCDLTQPIGSKAYRTRMPLALQDAQGHPIGSLPPRTLVISKSDLTGTENGWSAFIPLSLGDGSDASDVLVSAGKAPSLIPLTEMIMIDRSHKFNHVGETSPATSTSPTVTGR